MVKITNNIMNFEEITVDIGAFFYISFVFHKSLGEWITEEIQK